MGYGYLAQAIYGKRLALQVIKVNGEYIIGTLNGDQIQSRESVESWHTREGIIYALATHRWTQLQPE